MTSQKTSWPITRDVTPSARDVAAGNRRAATAACLTKQSVLAVAPSRPVRRGRAGRASQGRARRGERRTGAA